MKLFEWAKDGGPESRVAGLFFIEAKSLFTVALLRFDKGSREAYHSHAFNSVSWLLSGELAEHHGNGLAQTHFSGWRPIYTLRSTVHKVVGMTRSSWVLTFRGPWTRQWFEYDKGEYTTLTHGREVVK